MSTPRKPTLSFIVPAMNEAPTIRTLFDGIQAHATPVCRSFEIIFIDDGSSDGTWDEMVKLADEYPDIIKAIRHRRNFSKANALAEGYKEAVGELVFTMDADLQDDPAEIPNFIEKLQTDNLDIVSGYKETRHDPWHKVLPSRVFNKIISRVSGVKLHDHNCGFKCYRNEVVKTLPMYGGMHRMVPSIAGIFGYRSGEIVVKHHPREFGVSKYGTRRILHGIADIVTIAFIKNYRDQPNHILGIVALLLANIALAISTAMSFFSTPEIVSQFANLLSTASLTSALVLFFLGMLAEIEVWRSLLPSGDHQIAEQRGRHNNGNQLQQSRATTPRQKRALVADDDPIISRVLSNILNKDGWDIETATNFEEAVTKIDSSISVAFVDVHMPGPKHKEAVRQMLEKAPDTRIVTVSSDDCDLVSNAAMHAGATTFLQKPINPTDVLSEAALALKSEAEAQEEDIPLAR